MEAFFPMLQSSAYKLTSPATMEYNCIAWAAGDTETWWWPDPFDQYFWPSGILREETIDAFIMAFEFLGYSICGDANYETGYEKVAIYAKPGGTPTHAARQIDSEKWTSKIGQLEDIEHGINSLSGTMYGEPVVYMKRSKE
ncbi:MAG: hypothetical protein KAU17_05280 [Spirochaetales bacterium]|nr:hypothetical protein [Spirochaetales bacterium]